MFTRTKRGRYFRRCQKITDHIHKEVAKGRFVNEAELMRKFGKSSILAYNNELHLMGVELRKDQMTPAMEWMYYSRYFNHRSSMETRDIILFAVSILALLVSGASLWVSFRDYTEKKQPCETCESHKTKIDNKYVQRVNYVITVPGI